MKYPCVQQQSEEDCGAACLATIAKHYGRRMTLSQVRDKVGTGQSGTNLWGLQQGADQLGFNTRSVKASPALLNRLNEAPLPAIIHWQGKHWVVLFGQQGKKYVIADPGVGIRSISAMELAEGWMDWVMLLVEPDPDRFADLPQQQSAGLGRFFQRVFRYRSILAQAVAINLVVGMLSLVAPFLVQILTDDVLVRGDFKLLNTVAIAVIVMTSVSSILSLIQSNLIAHFAQRLELSLVLDFCKQILKLPLSYFEARRSGEVVSRLQDIQYLNQMISQAVVSLPSQFFVALISLGLMLFYSWKLTVLAMGVAIAMTVSTFLFQPALQQKTRAALATDAENQGVLVETFKGALTLKSTVAGPQFWDEFQGRFSRLAKLNLRTTQITIFNNSFSGLMSAVGGVALLWFGGNLVINPAESLSIGQLFAFKAMNDNFLALIGTVIGFVDEFTRAQAATERLTEVIEAKPEEDREANKPSAAIAADADLVCSDLYFDYPGRAELLANFSLQIPGGQVTALIGQSGCGKSTVAKLLAGLYQPQSGNLRVGLYNFQDLSLSSLRQQIVLVAQEPHFWSRTIVENFRISAPEATFEQIVRACQIAGADEFISKLPNKYQTVLGEFGANLSGGQRQRLAIARALVTNPSILILDESTNGLDPVNEAHVLDQLLRQRRGKTTILISHRPQVINRADWVVMLAQGKVVTQGTQAELKRHIGSHSEFLAA